MPNEWQIADVDLKAAKRIAKSLELSLIAAKIMVSRGLKTVKAARAWLDPELKDLGRPESMAGIPETVARILQAVAAGEKITVYGDFDVDGMTATAVMLNTLDLLGARANGIIPDRSTHGYGLNNELLQEVIEGGTKLLITVDCGIANVSEISEAKKSGLDVIVIDHHEPPSQLPPADIIINPRQADCNYPFKDLAAVGLAFKVAQALGNAAGQPQAALDQLDLVALGTVADLVPLVGENRILVAHGLKLMEGSRRPGLAALVHISGAGESPLSATAISFGLAPRLNAAGRLSSALHGLELLRANDAKTAEKLASQLDTLNKDRRQLEEDIYADAARLVKEEVAGATIVLSSPDWHDGVKGIVASRLVEKYARPTILFSLRDGQHVGSARSVPGLNIYESLEECSDLLVKWGGHHGAAGMTVADNQWNEFKERFEEVVARRLSETDYVQHLAIDLELSPDEVSEALVDELNRLAPFGQGNPIPVFSLCNVYADDYRELSGGRHIRFLAQAGDMITDAIAFRVDKHPSLVGRERSLDLAVQLDRNNFRGRSDLQLMVVDARAAELHPGDEDGVVRVPQPGQGFFLPAEAAADRSLPRLSIVDCRNHEDKDEWLRGFLGYGLPCALYVRDEHEGVHLADRLEKSGIGAGADLSIICSPDDFGADAGRLILYQVPLSARAIRALSSVGKSQPDRKMLYLLYDRDDLEKARVTIDSLCPSRTRLAEIYRLLKEHGPFGLDDAAALVRQELGDSLYQPATRQAAGRVMKVLAELHLIARDEEGKFSVSPDRVKVDLELSPSWRRMLAQREESETFLKTALTIPVDRLARI